MDPIDDEPKLPDEYLDALKLPDAYFDANGKPQPAPKSPEMIREVRRQLGLISEPDLAGVLGTTPRKLQKDRLEGRPVGPWVRPNRMVFYFTALLGVELMRQAEGRAAPFAEVVHRASPKRRRGVTA